MKTGRRWLPAALALALVPAQSCSEVESCKEGEPGCLNGATTTPCRFGLVASTDGRCVESSDQTATCTCSPGQVCTSTDQCVTICEEEPSQVKKPATIPCRASSTEQPYDFTEAAIALCYQECIRRAELCHTACDPVQDCTALKATAAVTTVCPGQNAECAMRLCETVRDQPCTSQVCPGNAAPDCAGVVCTNTCASTTTSFVNDGQCDDGDLSNATSAVCTWGSDCGDCGPRRGSAPPTSYDLGHVCVDVFQCGGDTSDFTRSLGWCISLQPDVDVQRCVPNCTASGQGCPSGFVCDVLGFGTSAADFKPLTDPSGRQARACFPAQSVCR